MVAAFATGARFLRAVTRDENGMGLAIPTRANLPVGSDVVLEIMWPELPNRVYMQGSVRARRADGCLIIGTESGESNKMRFLINAAGGAPMEIHPRKKRRYCVRLPVQWRPFGSRRMRPGVVEDLSVGGMLIVTALDAVDTGERLVVRLVADKAGRELVVTGVVRHVTERASGHRAIGLMFELRASGELRELRRLLRVFGDKGLVLLAPGH